eukprot:SAG11_NODE_15694_length_569_cov_0.940426_1_plen_118_part_10
MVREKRHTLSTSVLASPDLVLQSHALLSDAPAEEWRETLAPSYDETHVCVFVRAKRLPLPRGCRVINTLSDADYAMVVFFSSTAESCGDTPSDACDGDGRTLLPMNPVNRQKLKQYVD